MDCTRIDGALEPPKDKGQKNLPKRTRNAEVRGPLEPAAANKIHDDPNHARPCLLSAFLELSQIATKFLVSFRKMPAAFLKC